MLFRAPEIVFPFIFGYGFSGLLLSWYDDVTPINHRAPRLWILNCPFTLSAYKCFEFIWLYVGPTNETLSSLFFSVKKSWECVRLMAGWMGLIWIYVTVPENMNFVNCLRRSSPLAPPLNTRLYGYYPVSQAFEGIWRIFPTTVRCNLIWFPLLIQRNLQCPLLLAAEMQLIKLGRFDDNQQIIAFPSDYSFNLIVVPERCTQSGSFNLKQLRFEPIRLHNVWTRICSWPQPQWEEC